MKKNITLLIAVCIAIFTTTNTFAQIVTSGADDGSDGTLRQEIADTPAGGTITFLPTVLVVNLNSELLIDKELNIIGTPITTVIIDANNNGRIFNITTGPVTLVGLTLTNGLAPDGGGIYVTNATVTVNDCVITNNTANATATPGPAGSGGGILNDVGGILVVNNSQITSNTANRAGGGIEDKSGTGLSITLNNVNLDDNNAGVAPALSAPGNGGGLHITGAGSAIIIGGTANNNIAALEGGGLWNGSGTLTVNNLEIDGNDAQGAGADDGGGGIFNNGGTLIVQNGTTISNNTASGTLGSGGGIFSLSPGTFNVDGITISNNTAMRAGGGIEITSIAGETYTFNNVTLDGNIAFGPAPGKGGGFHISGAGDVNFNGGSVVNNTAFEGGGLWNGSGSMTVTGTSLTGNIADGDVTGGGGLFNNGGTLIVDATTILTGNIAMAATPGGRGGAIFNSTGGTLTLATGLTISDNYASRAGGAIEDASNTTLMLNGIILTGNSAGVDIGLGSMANPGNGGALHLSGTTNVTVTGASTISNNVAALEGGGLWNNLGTMSVDTSFIDANIASGNSADDGGGGIFNNGGTLQVGNATIISNNFANGTLGSGGGIFSTAGTVSIVDAVIGFNSANRAGGAIELIDGTLDVSGNYNISDNNTGVAPAVASPGNGGAVHITGAANSNFTGGTIQDNIAAREGGGLWNGLGTMTIDGTIIDGNTASGNASDDGGAGIFNNGGTLIVQNNTAVTNNIADGTAGSGGGILSIGGDVTVSSSSISTNRANRAGGGIELAGGTLTLTNVTLDMNNAGVSPAVASPGSGGGLHVTGPAPTTITGGTTNNNIAANEGGGLWNGSGLMTVVDHTINGNVASGNDAMVAGAAGGGGIYNEGGSLDLSGSIMITNNVADGAQSTGGGILVAAGSLMANGITIMDNLSNRAGGGIEANGGASIMLTNVSLDSNDTGVVPGAGAPGNGGGMHISGNSTVDVIGGTVNMNTAASEGGGLWNGTGIMTVDATTIDANTASGAGADNGGGGIYALNGGTVNLVNGATVSNNIANGTLGSGGGIFVDVDASFNATDAFITGNIANRAGGGVEIVSGNGSATLINVDLSGNNVGVSPAVASPGNGGGLHVTGPQNVSVVGGMVNNNLAALEGGGLWNGTGTMTVDGVTVANNTASGAMPNEGGGGLFNASGTLIVQNNSVITNNIANGTSGSGGGILNDLGTLTVMDSEISGNEAVRAGGGIEENSATGSLLTLTNVNLSNNMTGSNPGNGGGLHVSGPGDSNITDGMVNGNSASREGGGLWNNTGVMTIDGVTIDANTALGAAADDGGAGVFNNGGTLNILNETIISNNIATGASSSGGGLLSTAGTVTVNNSTFDSNSANRAGGAIELIDGDLMFTNSVMSNNDVNGTAGTPAPGNGGGFHVTGTDGTITFDTSTITGNSAFNEGGGLWNQNGTVMNVLASTIDNNTSGEGGGIYNNTGSITTVMTSTISGNTATVSGGGLTNNGASLDLNAVTVALNTAAMGGGIDAVNNVSLKNTIVALNTAGSGTDVSGVFTSNDYNLIGSDDLSVFAAQSNDLEGVNPMAGPLQDNGGTTFTHQLMDSSPAFDTGDPSDTFTDQIGQSVFGASRDIGAYESQVVLSIDQFNEVSVMKIYPNPTKGQFNIVIGDNVQGNVDVQIVSITGRLVKKLSIGNGINSMDIGNMASGMYIVNINTEKGSTSHKLILD